MGLGSKCLATGRLGATAGTLAGLAIASVEVFRALPKTRVGSLHAAAILGLVVPAIAFAGFLLGVYVELAVLPLRLTGGRRSERLTTLLLAAPLALLLLWTPASWISDTWQALSARARAWVVFSLAAAMAVSVAGAWLALLLARRRLSGNLGNAWLLAGALFAFVIAGLCYSADVTLYPGDYDDFHVALAVTGVLSGGVAFLLAGECIPGLTAVQHRLSRYRTGSLLAVTLAVAFSVGACLPPRAFVKSPAVVLDRVVSGARALTDFDQDGYSSLFGGTDCSAFDRAHSPGEQEIPGNDQDEDCSGNDVPWPSPPAPPVLTAGAKPLNLLLLTIDTARADHFGSYGYRRRTTPVLDELAQKSLVFLEAYAQATKTWDSVPSLLTGSYPSNLPRQYGVPGERPSIYRLLPDTPTLAEMLHAKGYLTSAFSPVEVLVVQGLDRGFDSFQVAHPTVPALRFLSGAREPFFAWLHYDEPHEPYVKHPDHDFGDSPLDRYDSDLAEADAQIGLVLAELAARHLDESTVIVVTADHGEEFMEHGGTTHLHKLYRELLHVPLIVHVPARGPGRVQEVVELVDVVPTLCEVLGLEARAGAFDGETLFDTPRSPARRGAYSEALRDPDGSVGKRSFFDGQRRLIQDRVRDRLELFDERKDPREQKNLAASRPQEVARLRDVLSVRVLRRYGAPFRDALGRGDPRRWSALLPTIQRPELLRLMLDDLSRAPSGEAEAVARRLLSRPSLDDELAGRARSLLVAR